MTNKRFLLITVTLLTVLFATKRKSKNIPVSHQSEKTESTLTPISLKQPTVFLFIRSAEGKRSNLAASLTPEQRLQKREELAAKGITIITPNMPH